MAERQFKKTKPPTNNDLRASLPALMNTLEIICTDNENCSASEQVAQQLSLELNRNYEKAEFRLHFGPDGVELISLKQPKQTPIQVNFHTGSAAHRRQFGGGKGQMIAKAVGIQGQFRPRVLDATAGLGGDAFVLASLGCETKLHERSPIAHALLADGLARGRSFAAETGDSELAEILERMHLSHANSIDEPFSDIDVVYVDPMFPERKKSAAVNKNMQAFHSIIGKDEDSQALLAHALTQPVKRVVVKRPRTAPAIEGVKPSYTLEGKSSRFDIYALKKLQPEG